MSGTEAREAASPSFRMYQCSEQSTRGYDETTSDMQLPPGGFFSPVGEVRCTGPTLPGRPSAPSLPAGPAGPAKPAARAVPAASAGPAEPVERHRPLARCGQSNGHRPLARCGQSNRQRPLDPRPPSDRCVRALHVGSFRTLLDLASGSAQQPCRRAHSSLAAIWCFPLPRALEEARHSGSTVPWKSANTCDVSRNPRPSRWGCERAGDDPQRAETRRSSIKAQGAVYSWLGVPGSTTVARVGSF